MKTRVLVVDDSPTIRKVVCAILERNGFEADAAEDGQRALEVLHGAAVRPDLVLVDFVMPRMNGFQFCRALREHPDLAGLPVVLMSAKSDKIREQFVQQTGAVDAITKPFDAQALVAVVEHAVRRLRSGRLPGALRSAPVLAEADLTEPAIPPSAPPASVALSGDVAEMPLGAVLQMLQVEQKSGVLVVTNGATEIRIALEGGLIDFVESRGAAEEFRLGRFFVEQGLLTPADLGATLAAQAAQTARVARASELPSDLLEPMPLSTVPAPSSLLDLVERTGGDAKPDTPMTVPLLGDALVRSGQIAEIDLRAALERQSSELVYDALRWTRGRFELRRDREPSLASSTKLRLPVAHVVMEGFRRVDEWRLIESRIESFEGVLQQDALAIEALEPSSLARTERQVLELVDGERSVREIVAASHMSSFDACKILYQLLEARLVRRRS